MNFRKLRRNVKAISPVISVLLMIAVAVAASLVTYAWVMGYLGFTTNKVGKAILVQSITRDGSGNLAIYVQNVGDSDVKLVSVYVDQTLDSGAVKYNGFAMPAGGFLLVKTATVKIEPILTSATTNPQVTVKVVTVDGISAEYTKTFP